MKKLVEIDSKNFIESLLGQIITVFCINYIYAGKLVAIDDISLILEEPSIIYETGAFNNLNWQDAQKLPQKQWAVMKHAVESYGIMKTGE